MPFYFNLFSYLFILSVRQPGPEWREIISYCPSSQFRGSKGHCKTNDKGYHFLISYYMPGTVLRAYISPFNLHAIPTWWIFSRQLAPFCRWINRGPEMNWLACSLSAKGDRGRQPSWADPRALVPATVIHCVLQRSYKHITYFSFLCKLPDKTSLPWTESWVRTYSLRTRRWSRVGSQHGQFCNHRTCGSSGHAGKAAPPSPGHPLCGEAGVGWGRPLDSRVALSPLPRRSRGIPINTWQRCVLLFQVLDTQHQNE